MPLNAAEIATVFSGDLRPFEQDARTWETRRKALDGAKVTTIVDADTRAAMENIGRLDSEARRLASEDTTLKVDADTTSAERGLDDLADKAEGAGADGGRRSGKALATGLVAAVAAIPIAGAVAKLAEAAGNAVVDGFQEGLAVEVRADVLAARTGLDPAAVSRLATAAGEAYADNFGESIEGNIDSARRAVQSGLLDPKATQRDAQEIIASLSGVADVLEEDVGSVARATAQLLKTGVAANAQEAFDIIVAGQQAGLNVSEDWLDTISEYSTQWRELGLTTQDVLGLLSQGVQAGARDTDVASDALKEYAIRARDGSQTTKDGFDAIGLSAETMADKIAKGGTSAREALGETLDGLREIEDPVKRDAAAVALFGTQAEDLGDALYAMDLDTAAKDFDDLDGSARRALDTIGDNSAGKIESARRNIEVAADGIKGALAEAFAPQLGEFADEISQNRERVVQFLLDVANGGIDAGRALIEGAAAGTEGFGDFVGTVGPEVLGLIQSILEGIDSIPFVDLGGAVDDFKAMREEAEASFAEFDAGSEQAADSIRTNLIENGLDPAQDKLNKLGDGMLNQAALSDATNRLADDIGEVGYAADGSKIAIDQFDGSIDTTTETGKRLDRQLRDVKGTLDQQVSAAAAAGEGQKQLRGRVESARQAFIDQVTALGLTADQAGKLADKYGLIPSEVVTKVVLDLAEAQQRLAEFRQSATVRATLNDGRARSGFAGGGPIVGPGSGTSDDVVIAASNGEHMWTADEVQKAGGHAAVHRLRAAVRNGLARFAGGGAVESQRGRVEAARHWVEESREGLARAREGARRAKTDADERRAERLVNRAETLLERRLRTLESERDKLARLVEQTRETRTSLRRGEFGGDLGTVDELLEQSRNTDLSARSRRSLASTAARAEGALARLERQSAKVEANLQGARDRMEELASISDGVASHLTGELDLRSLLQPQVGASLVDGTGGVSGTTGNAVAAGVRATANRIREFSKKLAALAKAGLKGRALSEVEQLGSVEGSELADALLADRRSIASLNSAYVALDQAAAAAGQAVTEGYYKGGLNAAEGVVAGLERQLGRLDKQIDRWGERMGQAIAKALGIKARAGGGPVEAGQPYLVNEDTPYSELFVPNENGTILNRNQMRGLSGPSVNVNVYAMTPTPGPIVAAVADELAWQLRG